MTAEETTTERWLPIPGWEGSYSVSDLGRVRSEARSVVCNGRPRRLAAKIMTPARVGYRVAEGGGYFAVWLQRDGRKYLRYLHRLVLRAFVGMPQPKQEVNHRNAVKTDNRLPNLEYVTKSENAIHAVRLQRHPLVKLSESDVLEIRRRRGTGEKVRSLMHAFGIKSSQSIRNILTGKTWSHLG